MDSEEEGGHDKSESGTATPKKEKSEEKETKPPPEPPKDPPCPKPSSEPLTNGTASSGDEAQDSKVGAMIRHGWAPKGKPLNQRVCFSGLAQDCSFSGALTMALLQSYTKASVWASFMSVAWSKLRLCSANHRPGYWSNLPCDWPSTAWAYSKQETQNGPWTSIMTCCWMSFIDHESFSSFWPVR